MSLPPEILMPYFEQSKEDLRQLEHLLLTMEANREVDEDERAEAMRLLHTLKGGGGMLGFFQVRDIAHGMESLVQNIQSMERDSRTKVLQVLLEARDELVHCLSSLEANGPEARRTTLSVLKRLKTEYSALTQP